MDLTGHSLLEEWGSKNFGVNPEKVSTKQKVWWVCKLGHEWETTVASRVYNNTNCPYCSGLKLASGFNDFASTHPALIAQWDYTKNVSVDPTQIFSHTQQKVWWVCEKGHEWEATVQGRAKNPAGNCLQCFQDPKDKKTSLLHIYPHLISYWDDENTISPETVKPDSDKNILWTCEHHHKWVMPPHNILRRKNPCPECSLATNVSKVIDDLNNRNIKLLHSEEVDLEKTSSEKRTWECEKGHKWEATYRSVTRNKTSCPLCAEKTFVSHAEKTINQWLNEQLSLTTVTNTRNILPGNQELDIWVPEKRIAIEFNGLYWHDENHKPKNYHYDKWLACKNQGIQLIQIWEDDWNRNPDLIKRMLTHKLNSSKDKKIYARRTTIQNVTLQKATNFLNNNHIQGAVLGGIHVGLFAQGTMVALMVLQKRNNMLNILRYATSQPVVGGFTKLLKHVETTYTPTQIVTFSDNTVSDGGLYENTGFEAVKFLPPDYMYVYRKTRHHKFGYRLKKFKNSQHLKYVEGFTEKQLADLNNIPRIWDAGKTKWVKNVS